MSDPGSTDLAALVRRLARKLDCESIALVGCAEAALTVGMQPMAVASFEAAAAAPGIAALAAPLVVFAADALDALDDDALNAILAAAQAGVVYAATPATASGPGALVSMLEALRLRGLQVARAELLAPDTSATHRCPGPVAVISSDPRVRELVTPGLKDLALDPEVDSSSPGSRPCRVCIVSYEVVGHHENGGIGTANTSLAQTLARAGHEVTLLYTGAHGGGQLEHWREHFRSDGVTYEQLDPDAVARVGNPSANVRRAWTAYQWLRERHEARPYDVIHAPECQGHGYYIALAKRHGVSFAGAQVVIGVHSTTRWCYDANRQLLGSLEQLTNEYLERMSAESADVVISPSNYLLGYLRAVGWQLPERSFVQQYTPSQAVRTHLESQNGSSAEHRRTPPTELVFFGRLETRKGLEVFCDALDKLAETPPSSDLRVTFMGRAVELDGAPSTRYVERRAAHWPWPVTMETEHSQPEAVAYLAADHRLAVMPSLVDNSPNTVYEALGLGIPFITSRAGGTSELIAIEDLERCSFQGLPEDGGIDPVGPDMPPRTVDASGLARMLSRSLSMPAASIRSSIDTHANEQAHLAWHAALATDSRRADAQPVAADADLLIVVGDDVQTTENMELVLHRAASRSDADLFVFPVLDGDDPTRAIVPTGGPPILALAFPFFGPGIFAIRPEALRELGGLDEQVQARAALTGMKIEVVPEILGQRTTTDPWREVNAKPWLDAVSWPVSDEQRLSAMRPFRSANGTLSDLPALFRDAQESLATVQERQRAESANWRAIHSEAVGHIERMSEHYDALREHADRVSEHAANANEHADRVAAHAEQVNAHKDRELEQLRAQLAVIQGSTSWRITEPLRRARRLLRRT